MQKQLKIILSLIVTSFIVGILRLLFEVMNYVYHEYGLKTLIRIHILFLIVSLFVLVYIYIDDYL